jgi:hypothetical protein
MVKKSDRLRLAEGGVWLIMRSGINQPDGLQRLSSSGIRAALGGVSAAGAFSTGITG